MDIDDLLAVLLATRTNPGERAISRQDSPSASPGQVGTAVPMVSRDQFAAAVGVPAGVVQGWIERRLIPTIKIGKYRLINLALLQQSCGARSFHDHRGLFASAASEHDATTTDTVSTRRSRRRRPIGDLASHEA